MFYGITLIDVALGLLVALALTMLLSRLMRWLKHHLDRERAVGRLRQAIREGRPRAGVWVTRCYPPRPPYPPDIAEADAAWRRECANFAIQGSDPAESRQWLSASEETLVEALAELEVSGPTIGMQEWAHNILSEWEENYPEAAREYAEGR